MTTMRPRRSALYLPASRAGAIAKARTLPCDMVILDLEDAVGPDEKRLARELAVQASQDGGFGHRELLIRANSLDSPWGEDDLAALRQCDVDGILLPKISSAEDLYQYRQAIDSDLPMWAMMETCRAFLNLAAIGAISGELGVAGFILGTNDLALEMRCRVEPGRMSVLPLLTSAVVAARAHGIAVIDGVFNDIADGDGLLRECQQGIVLGFDGKTVIHPSQIETANRVYSPDLHQVSRAEAVITAFSLPENQGKGVIKVDGKMTELLHLREAERQLQVHRAIAARGG